jgi:3-methyl-2-oxobutanoate hydroxymethyltransferase
MKTVLELQEKKNQGQKITWLTCYDYWSAKILKETSVDALLIGDSVAMVMHGFDSTVHATTDMIATHTQAVARAQTGKLLVADLPFLAHRSDRKHLMVAVDQLMKSGAQALKIETAPGQEEGVRWLTDSGIPMIGHVGLTPQFVHQLGGYKVQGRDPAAQDKILQHALALQVAGCHAIVLECVPIDLAQRITQELRIPTIGIGAGVGVDGQVLVLHDLLGLNKEFKPRFVRHFAQGFDWVSQAIHHYSESVESQTFPSNQESFQ